MPTVEQPTPTASTAERFMVEFEKALGMLELQPFDPPPPSSGDPRPRPELYFIRCPLTRLVKVGTSTNVPGRLLALRTGCPTPLEIVGTFAHRQLSQTFEFQIHRALTASRSHGEWYYPTPELQVVMDRLLKTTQEELQ